MTGTTYRRAERKKLDKRGITMVELIVVVVLVMMLVFGLVYSIARWATNAVFIKQNEYASHLFTAAQNQLTEYEESGQLEVFQEKLYDRFTGSYDTEHIIDVKTLRDTDGNLYDIDKVWPESSDKDQPDRYRDRVYSLIGTPEDYDNYLAGTADSKIDALYQLLEQYLYDTSILHEGVVCIEFTPEGGQVFSAFYSDRVSAFKYDGDSTKDSANISNRETQYRKKYMVGYYGVDTLYKATTTKLEKPSIAELRLNNEDTLNLSFRIGRVPTAIQKLQYEITVFDKKENNSAGTAKMTFTLDGTKLKNKEYRQNIPCKVTRYQYDNEGKLKEQYIGEYNVLAWVENTGLGGSGRVRIVLDGADQEATTVLYYEAYKDLTEEEPATEEEYRTSLLMQGKYVLSLKSTMSFLRFGLTDTNDIYCTVRGQGEDYKTTARKQSNTENALFGSVRTSISAAEKTVTYSILNGRHLNNIRYVEDYTAEECEDLGIKNDGVKNTSYVIGNNIDWAAFSQQGNLFKSGADKPFEYPSIDNRGTFISLRSLKQGSHFGCARQAYTISGLNISAEENLSKEVYENIAFTGMPREIVQPRTPEGELPEDTLLADKTAGLFLENEGEISNVSLDRIKVSGGEGVGAFCGVNRGVLENLTVLNTKSNEPAGESVIQGIKNVGGITGTAEKSEPLGGTEPKNTMTLEKLTNYARVTEPSDVIEGEDKKEQRQGFGGIIGSIITNDNAEYKFLTTVEVKNCKNYGQVEANSASRSVISHIGGISGYSNNQGEEILFENCTSSPQYSMSAIATDDAIKEKLRGEFVGGIVGYAKDTTIKYCNTKKETTSKEGYIFGNENVGGIVGFYEVSKGETAEINGTLLNGKYSVNEAHVIGATYVGGIVGKNPSGTIRGWENAGFVGATKKCAGGITGSNGDDTQTEEIEDSAQILDCTSEVVYSKVVRALASHTGLFVADYVGGIAGYNDGVIKTTSDNTISLESNVTGGNFVGGIIGYNDTNGWLNYYDQGQYILNGGYISGSGSFVGGYCGFNASPYFFGSYAPRESNPNQVTGAYCVGGVIGGNINKANTFKNDDYPVYFYFLTDNFMGKVEAEHGAYVGGFIGYNRMVTIKTSGIHIRQAAEEYTDRFSKLDKLSYEEKLKEIAEPDELFHNSNLISSKMQFIINGARGQSNRQVRLNSISGLLYVGGVVGCNDEDTRLLIVNIDNKTPVTATASVENPKEQGDRKDYQGRNFTYSYAGGMIGKVTKNANVSTCNNLDSGMVISQGTYTGGLCEINEGTVQYCNVSSLGASSADYVGGIVGLNKAGARIENCKLVTGKTITGQNIVGGLVAENYGIVYVTPMKGGIVRSVGPFGRVGGIAGYNGDTGEIRFKLTTAVLNDIDVDITITASGNYVGGIAGVNQGIIARDGNARNIRVAGTITGNQYVGGVTGLSKRTKATLPNDRRPIAYITNQAAVTAQNGYAGGIAGASASGSEHIGPCQNEGTVIALKGGLAGGIVSINEAEVYTCENFGVVNSPNGICGGICAQNGTVEGDVVNGYVNMCKVYPKDMLARLSFTGKQQVGGVCGINYGKISRTEVAAVDLYDLADSNESMLGGIAGENKKKALIEGCKVGQKTGNINSDDLAKIKVTSRSAASSIGGGVGYNSGKIKQFNDNTKIIVNADLSFTETALSYYGNMGGVAGVNEGQIQDSTFTGRVGGTANNPQNPPQYDPTRDEESSGAVIYGYGGIAGVNRTNEDVAKEGNYTSGLITKCEVKSAEITGLGDATNIANIGGIAGVNDVGATISYVKLGEGDGTYNAKFKDHTSGNSSMNLIKPEQTYNVYVGTERIKGLSDSKQTTYGHVGGVVGLNAGAISQAGYEHKKNSDGSYSNPSYSEIGNTSVIVENYRGHVGGIVGYNRRTGIVEKSATGTKWTVFAYFNAPDNGCGGIIGYQAGENGITLCTNGALVVKIISGSNGVGGMVGRMEVATAKNYQIYKCVNYGRIYGAERVGGMVGIAKYYGGTISNCVNYGEIQSLAYASGGMIGHLYSMDKKYGAVSVIRCANHGTIQSATYSAGGIIGYATQKAALVDITDCVNTGLIKAASSFGGIIGISSSDYIDSDSKIVRCRNYGYALNDTKNDMGGIVPKEFSNTKVTISECFGIADLTNPIGPSKIKLGNNKNNYYLTAEQAVETDQVQYYDKDGKPGTGTVDKFYVRSVEADISIQKANNGRDSNLYKIVANAEEGLNDSARAYYSSNDVSKAFYTFTFSKAIDLSKVILVWFSGNDKDRIQNYKVWYSEYTKGDFKKVFAEVDNISKSNRGESIPERQEIESGSAVLARRVKIEITKSISKNTNKAANVCLARANFIGQVDGVEYQGYQLDGNKYNNANGYNFTYKNENPAVFSGMSYETCEQVEVTPSGGDKGVGKGVTVEDISSGSGSSYRLVEGTGEDEKPVGYTGFPLDPYTALRFAHSRTDAGLSALGGTNNIRYQVYEADDPWFVVGTASVTSLAAPTGLNMSGVAGGITASWNAVDSASYYKYKLEYFDKNKKSLGEPREDIVYGTSVEIPVPQINGKDVAKVCLTVWAGTTVQDGEEIKELWSDPSETMEHELSQTLPTPQYHFEMVMDNNTLKYQAILDNRADYEAFLRQQGVQDIETELGNINIEIKISGVSQTFVFDVKNGKSKKYFDGAKGANIMFAATAKGKTDTYRQSSESLRESPALEHSEYDVSKGFAVVKLSQNDERSVSGFYGETAETLNYLVSLRISNGGTSALAYYMRTEFMAVDLEVGVPVSLSSSEVRISNVVSDDISTTLASLPYRLLDNDKYSNFMVRSYPTVMSNNVVYNGHDVDLTKHIKEGAIGVTADVLKTLYVSGDNQVSETGSEKLINNGKLAAGFVIRRNEDETYSLYYNTLLAYNTKVKNDDYKKGDTKTQMLTQVFYYYLNETLTRQKPPVIKAKMDVNAVTGDLNQDIMTVTWDLIEEGYENEDGGYNYKEGAVYDYTVTGYLPEGTSVPITVGQYTTDRTVSSDSVTAGKNTLRLNTSSWNYTSVVIGISRRGETDNTGKTKIFPGNSELTQDLKLRFSQVEGPTVVLHSEDGIMQKNSLIYDVTWNNIPKEERGEDLRAYELKITRNLDEDTKAVFTYDTDDKYNDEVKRLIELYNEKTKGAEVTKGTDEKGRETLQWVWYEQGLQGDTAVKRMTIVLEKTSTGGIITKNLSAYWLFFATDKELGEDIMTRSVNLSDFERGEALDVSVRVMAKDTAEIYRHGPSGVITGMTLPSRLDVPDVNLMKSTPIYALDNFMTVTQLRTEGIALDYKETNISEYTRGVYQIAAAIYKDEPDYAKRNDKSAVAAGDGFWNADADYTIATKDNPIQMSGDLKESKYLLNEIPKEHAGKWMKIAMRSISNNNISSWWSDEDEGAQGTVNYVWIQIPRVQEETPSVKQSTVNASYVFDEESGRYIYSEKGGLNAITVSHTSISFKETSLTDHYRIQLVRKAGQTNAFSDDGNEYVIRYADWIYVEKAEDGSRNVFYATSSPSFDADDYRKKQKEAEEEKKEHGLETKEIPVSVQDENAVYIGTVGMDELITLPYEEEVESYNEPGADMIVANAKLRLTDEDGEKTVTLLLPDVEEVTTDAGMYAPPKGLFTDQAAFQSVISKVKSVYFENSRIAQWYRTEDAGEVDELETYAKAPEYLTYELIEAGEQNKDALVLKPTNEKQDYWLVADIRLKDKDGNLIRQKYISSYGYGISDIHNVILLPKDLLVGEDGALAARIDYRTAYIDRYSNRTCKGISQWSDWEKLDVPESMLPEESEDSPLEEQPENPPAEQPEDSAEGGTVTVQSFVQSEKAARVQLGSQSGGAVSAQSEGQSGGAASAQAGSQLGRAAVDALLPKEYIRRGKKNQ